MCHKIIVSAGLLFVLISSGERQARASESPPAEAVQFAQETSDLLLAELLAALLQNFSETTPENIEQSTFALSLVFDDSHTNFRLVGTFEPLSANNLPNDDFEDTALDLALQGQGHTAIDNVEGRWYYRSSVALSNFDASCALCHTNFGSVDPNFFVGGLMLKVPIADEDSDSDSD